MESVGYFSPSRRIRLETMFPRTRAISFRQVVSSSESTHSSDNSNWATAFSLARYLFIMAKEYPQRHFASNINFWGGSSSFFCSRKSLSVSTQDCFTCVHIFLNFSSGPCTHGRVRALPIAPCKTWHTQRSPLFSSARTFSITVHTVFSLCSGKRWGGTWMGVG